MLYPPHWLLALLVLLFTKARVLWRRYAALISIFFFFFFLIAFLSLRWQCCFVKGLVLLCLSRVLLRKQSTSCSNSYVLSSKAAFTLFVY